MNKNYYIEQAKNAIKKAENELKVIEFICNNNITGYDCDYFHNRKILKLYINNNIVKVFEGYYDNLAILKRLENKSKYQYFEKDELISICKTLCK